LNIYDGYNFREIPYFRSVQINCLAYDTLQNHIWAGTDNGLYYVDPQTGDVISCTSESRLNAVSGIAVSNGFVYVTFSKGTLLRIAQNMSCSVLFSTKQINARSHLPDGRMAVHGNCVYLAPTHCRKIIILNLTPGIRNKFTLVNAEDTR